MGIEFNVDNSIKSAKDIYLGKDGAKRRIVKILTSVNGEKRTIYESKNPSVLGGYYFVGSSKLYHTNDFINFDIFYENNSVINKSPIFTDDGRIVCFTFAYNSGVKKSVPEYCHIISEDGTSSVYECSLIGSFITSSLSSPGGIQSDVHYYRGVFYYIFNTQNISNNTYYNYTYLLYSLDGIEWNIILVDSHSEGTGTNVHNSFSAIRGFISSNDYTFAIIDFATLNAMGNVYTHRMMVFRIKKDFSQTALQTVGSNVLGYGKVVEVSEGLAYDDSYKYTVVNDAVNIETLTEETRVAKAPYFYDGTHYYGFITRYETNINKVYYDLNIAMENVSVICGCLSNNGMVFYANNQFWRVDSLGIVSQLSSGTVPTLLVPGTGFLPNYDVEQSCNLIYIP